MKLLVILIPALLLAQSGPKGSPGTDGIPKLTQPQKDEHTAALITRERAEKAVYKLDSDYMELRRKAVEAAQHANGAYGEVVKKLQALAPAGCQLTEAGEFDCSKKPEAKPTK